MEIARIEVSGAMARVRYRDPIPAGLVGGTVAVDYSEDIWNGLTKTVVFRGSETRDVVTDEAAVTIPHETVAEPGRRLYVGFYGTDKDGTLVIPTIWADLGMIRDATDPSGDVSTDPSLPVYAQLAQQIGDLRDQVENMTPGGGSGGAVDFETDETLTLKDGVLSVNTTGNVEQDNTLPITSAGVFATVGNIEALLKTI